MKSHKLISGFAVASLTFTACAHQETEPLSLYEEFFLESTEAGSSTEYIHGFLLGSLVECNFIESIPDVSLFNDEINVLNSEDYVKGVGDGIHATAEFNDKEMICADLGRITGFATYY